MTLKTMKITSTAVFQKEYSVETVDERENKNV